MREFKFRVWDIQKEKFIPSEVYAILNRTDFNAFGVMTKDWENYCEGEYFYDNFQVLQWYSGVKDKNGVEIYEGDNTNFGEVFFNYGCFCIKGENGDSINFMDCNLNMLEVI